MIQARYNIGQRVIDRGKHSAKVVCRMLDIVGNDLVLYYRIRHDKDGQIYRAYENELSTIG